MSNHVTLEISLAIRPVSVADPLIDRLCAVMRESGRDELIHYSGACYRDEIAWQVVLAWAEDRNADQATLLSRAYKAAGIIFVSADDVRAALDASKPTRDLLEVAPSERR